MSLHGSIKEEQDASDQEEAAAGAKGHSDLCPSAKKPIPLSAKKPSPSARHGPLGRVERRNRVRGLVEGGREGPRWGGARLVRSRTLGV